MSCSAAFSWSAVRRPLAGSDWAGGGGREPSARGMRWAGVAGVGSDEKGKRGPL